MKPLRVDVTDEEDRGAFDVDEDVASLKRGVFIHLWGRIRVLRRRRRRRLIEASLDGGGRWSIIALRRRRRRRLIEARRRRWLRGSRCRPFDVDEDVASLKRADVDGGAFGNGLRRRRRRRLIEARRPGRQRTPTESPLRRRRRRRLIEATPRPLSSPLARRPSTSTKTSPH